MDYEQKYKNLVERLMKAKEDYDIADERYCCVIDGLIPEPQEEDERIRKEIISYIKSSGAVTNPNWLAWLEKQGQEKTTWVKEDEIGFIDAMWAIDQARTIAKDENDLGNLWYAEKWLDSLKDRVQPHPAWKPTEEQMKAIKHVAEQNRASEIGNILDNLFVELKNM